MTPVYGCLLVSDTLITELFHLLNFYEIPRTYSHKFHKHLKMEYPLIDGKKIGLNTYECQCFRYVKSGERGNMQGSKVHCVSINFGENF